MQVFIASFGTRGDIELFLTLGRELAGRGIIWGGIGRDTKDTLNENCQLRTTPAQPVELAGPGWPQV